MSASTPTPKLSLELFDERIIALNREVAHHPKLRQILKDQEVRDVYILILEIATYCDVLLVADVYTKEDILEICEKLTKALYEKRTQVIIPFAQ
jgi:mannose/fructose/N-acetylgalactosamine-specific phosphotransferase system component IIB